MLSKQGRKNRKERQKLKKSKNRGDKSTAGIITSFHKPMGFNSTNIYKSEYELTKQLPGCFEGNFR